MTFHPPLPRTLPSDTHPQLVQQLGVDADQGVAQDRGKKRKAGEAQKRVLRGAEGHGGMEQGVGLQGELQVPQEIDSLDQLAGGQGME